MLLAIPAYPENYFVKNGGIDSANGTSELTPWAYSPSMASATGQSAGTTLIAGDTISFRKGDTWSEAVTYTASGSIGIPIAYGAYGSGANPIISSAATNTVSTGTESYVTWDGIDITSTGTRAVLGGASTGLIFSNFTATTDTEGLLFSGTVADLTVDNVDIIGTTPGDALALALTAAGNTNITITGCTATIISGFLLTTCDGVVMSGCTALNCRERGFLFSASSNMTITDCTATGTEKTGFRADTASHDITYTDCVSNNGDIDGFGLNDISFNITYTNCTADGNGNKATTSAGDGFTYHDTCYNINSFYCISSNNTASGWGMVDRTSGLIYNCIAYNNAGDWTVESGLDQVRGGIWINTTDDNPTSGVGWSIKNCILSGNYPVEISLTATAAATMVTDYNCYNPDDDNSTADVGAGAISWDTYHASFEANSFNDDPLFPPDVFGPELITNGDMELDSDWANNGSPTANERVTAPDPVNTLTYSRKFSGSGGNAGIKQSGITTVTGTSYKAVLYVYPDDTTTVSVLIREGDDSGFAANSPRTGLTQGDWNRIEIDFTVTAGGSGTYFAVTAGSSTGDWYVDDVSLKSTGVKSFVPAPGSPVVNAGIDVGLTFDFAGNPIIDPPDVGAYEIGRRDRRDRRGRYN